MGKDFKVKTILLAILLIPLFTLSSSVAAVEWPTRPITIICFASAGGGTDVTNRAMAAAMEKDLAQPITVANMPGGAGGVASTYVWKAKHDGYVWLGASEGIIPGPVLSAHEYTTKHWDFFMVGGAPGVISVRADSPYKTFEDLLKDFRRRPGEIKVAASSAGCIWHVKMSVLTKYSGITYAYIPYMGSHPSQVAALAGEVDIVCTSLGEQAEYLKAGKLRPLVMTEPEPVVFPGVGTIPAITDYLPELKQILPIDQWLGVAIPFDTPQEIKDKIEWAFKRAMESDIIKKLSEVHFMRLYGYSGKKAREVAEKQERLFSWILHDLGLTKKSPEVFGIPKP